jgi:hypothetical protein
MTAIGDWIARAVAHMFTVFRDGAVFIVGKVLATFGITLVSMNALLPDLKAFLMEYTAALPPAVTEMAAAVGLDVFFTMILSALTVRLAGKIIPMPTSLATQLGAVKQ